MALTFVTGGFKSQPLSSFNFQQIERGKTRLFLMDLLLKVFFFTFNEFIKSLCYLNKNGKFILLKIIFQFYITDE